MTQLEQLSYQAPLSPWTAPPGLKNHLDQPILPNAWFFQAPPAEIGPLVSADSNVPVGYQPTPFWQSKVSIIGGIIALALAAVICGGNIDAISRGRYTALVGAAIAFVVIMGISLLIAYGKRKIPTVSYVAQFGVAQYRLTRGPSQPPLTRVFLFHDAAELRKAVTRHFTNGAYTGTTYNFTWSNEAGQKVFTISGGHHTKEGMPPASDQYCFATAAEISWSQFLFDRIADQLQHRGSIHFNVKGNDYVRVGPGFFEFCFGGNPQKVTTDEIKTLSLAQGTFHIVHKDARWFSSKGKFSFQYGSIANAMLFRFAIRKLLGYDV